MTQRERNLLYILLGLVGAAALAGIAFFLIAKPLREVADQKESLEKDLAAKRTQLMGLLRDRKLIATAKERSLPLSPHQANIEYQRYLNRLLKDSALEKAETKLLTNLDAKAGTVAAAKGKKATQTILAYQVKAEGNLDKMVRLLTDFQDTPVMHRIKRISLDRRGDTQDGRLGVLMEVEALIFHDISFTHKPNLNPKKDESLPGTHPERVYASVAQKNFFLGYLKPPPPPPPPSKEKKPVDPPRPVDPPPPPDPYDTRQFVRLEFFLPGEGEAYYRNQLEPVVPGPWRRNYERLNTKEGSNLVRIKSESGRRVVDGKVIRVDQRDLYFKVDDKYFAWHVGQTLAEAMAAPLSASEVKALGLTRGRGAGEEKTGVEIIEENEDTETAPQDEG